MIKMMKEKSIWNEFTNMYSISKTLRFKLKPIGKTFDNIKKKGLIEEDKDREKGFNNIKKIMDDYYRYFIEKCLNGIKLEKKDLEAYQKVYEDLKKDNKNQKLKNKYAKNQTILRKEIYNHIKSQKEFSQLFKKELITHILPEWLEKNKRLKDKNLVNQFNNWSTYFTGFFNNRKNVFSEKEIPTSIIYRIVHVNLPKYLDNVSRFEKIKEFNLDLKTLENDFKDVLDNMDLNEFFSVNNFNNFLNQSGIDKFNLVIGGKSLEDNKKIKGLNEYINEFSQKESDKAKRKNIRKLKFAVLFKQILSDSESSSFVIEKFKDKKEIFETIDVFYKEFNKYSSKIKESITKLNNCDSKNVYIKNDTNLTQISKGLFNDWNKIDGGLRRHFENELKIKKLTDKQREKELDKCMKSKYFSLYEIEKGINSLELKDKKSIIDYFLNFSKSKNDSKVDLFENIKSKYSEFNKIDRNKTTKLTEKSSENDVELIKTFLDAIMELYHFIKPLHLNFKKNEDEKGSNALETDSDFYNYFNEIFDKLGEIIPLYNKVRNYVTQKPFSTKKFKLNFENSTLAAGWDINKETANTAIILKKGTDFYLGIIDKNNTKIFLNQQNSNSSVVYEKLCYKLVSGANKMLPKVFLSEKGVKTFKPSKEILKLYKNEEHKKGNTFSIESCHKLIDYFKECMPNYKPNPNDKYGWDVFKFKFSDTKTYKDISDFYREVENQGYKIWFENIDESYLNKLVDEGKLYLFQIWNKDFSKYSKGKPNLHTMYWKELFSEENLKDVIYKLNGEAELFYREASIKRQITHPKNISIDNKNPIKNKEKSTFNYDLIKNKRYSEDSFMFHCPITLNFKAKDQSKSIHKLVNKFIHDTDKKINIVGIDRGERNLAYYTLVNSDGNIIEQESFNIISDDLQRKFDYQEKLDQIEGDRDKARKNWKKIANIKEMKTGYLSQVIHKISKLVIEHDAIIVLEDLNYGFKRGRFKIEKQIYQKFEKMLVDKLNYLVFKGIDKTLSGGNLNAYQLTNKFESFQKLGKQSGIIYYVDAYKTSKICPKTGFVNLLYPKFENILKSQEFIKKFKSIKYHKDEDLFEFNFNYSDFKKDQKEKLEQDNWSIWSNGTKLINFRDKENNNQWTTKEFKVTEKLKELFENHNIDYNSGNDLIEQIVTIENKSFYESLIYILKIILKLRNSYSDFEVKQFKKKLGNKFKECDYDYILSCVKDKEGNFFDSRHAKTNEVKDADANGAFHIALKGLMVIDKIKKFDDVDEKTKIDLKIPRTDFLNYVVKRINR